MNLKSLVDKEADEIIRDTPGQLIVDINHIAGCREVGFILVDIRPEAEFEKADLDGSANIPYQSNSQFLRDFSRVFHTHRTLRILLISNSKYKNIANALRAIQPLTNFQDLIMAAVLRHTYF